MQIVKKIVIIFVFGLTCCAASGAQRPEEFRSLTVYFTDPSVLTRVRQSEADLRRTAMTVLKTTDQAKSSEVFRSVHSDCTERRGLDS